MSKNANSLKGVDRNEKTHTIKEAFPAGEARAYFLPHRFSALHT